ncbi:fructosamine kinase family protein [Chondrinema litorale]|uniref:fructosamine kinase family protein n=1 Tax=Chondrinema litorale TaxID=2994555 RepID=UPI0025430261|nr:fructosamine kinase family protein [Chondrinema litorale]UZR94441.1 fructosamine kinase family protein [Chondrinema litorale]
MSNKNYSYLENCLQSEIDSGIVLQDVSSLSGGCINAASKLVTNKGVFFAKWNANCPDDLFLREAECLTELKKAGSILAIPEVYLALEPVDTFPALLITEFMSPASDRSSQDEALGIGLAQIHQFTQKQFGFAHDNYCGATLQDNTHQNNWIDFYRDQRLGNLLNQIKAKRPLDSHSLKIYDSLLDKLPEIIGHQPDAALNHGDLWSGNYMYSEKGPALIDPASAYADRELDLALTTMFGGFSSRFWAAYEETFPLPAEWRERNNLYMLYHYLNHYFLFGGGYGMQALEIAKSYL